jgi:salicylate hydroxylase
MIGIAGSGIGGLSLAIALRKLGFDVVLFEQTKQFGRAGADINLTPNAVHALDGLGLGEELRRLGARPTHRVSRVWDTGEETSRLEMSEAAERAYGSPQLTLHRADLMQTLEATVPLGSIQFGKRVETVVQADDGVTVGFADGGSETVDVLIGADGIHSAVRNALFGGEKPRFTGIVAYRAMVPAERVTVPGTEMFTKWWGPTPESMVVTFPISAGRDIFIFATNAQDSWREESWSLPGSIDELRSVYAGYHPDARGLLDACDSVLKTALYERDPLPEWTSGRVTLLGDASHPMMPFMAQGAGSAIEDAVVLARCLKEYGDRPVGEALRAYEATRKPRTSMLQVGSRGNEWLRGAGTADWVYGYDAWTVPLERAGEAVQLTM